MVYWSFGKGSGSSFVEPLRRKTRCFEFPVAMVLKQVMLQELISMLVHSKTSSTRSRGMLFHFNL